MKLPLIMAALLLASPALSQEFAIAPDPTLTPGAVRTTDVDEILTTQPSPAGRGCPLWPMQRVQQD